MYLTPFVSPRIFSICLQTASVRCSEDASAADVEKK
jgi:hypothetical protein